MEKNERSDTCPTPGDNAESRDFLSILGYPVCYLKVANIGGTGDGWWIFNERGHPIAGFELECKSSAYFYIASTGLKLMDTH